MRILLRADASAERGTGHVMRCLTLGEAFQSRGHDIALACHVAGVPWLETHLSTLGIPTHPTQVDDFDLNLLARVRPDRVVVDSYSIDPGAISAVDHRAPVLAIIDHETRAIEASWYLDHNLGAERRHWPDGVRSRMLAGSRYALVRSAITRRRRDEGWRLPADPAVVAFMGGTDPFRRMTEVATRVATQHAGVDFTAVTTAEQVRDVEAAISTMPRGRVMAPTEDLPSVLGEADVIISAAGTSAWDVLSMGRPVLLVGVVDNQTESLAHAIEGGLALGIDSATGDLAGLGDLLTRILSDEETRRRLVSNANAAFDGRGADRVALALEREPTLASLSDRP